MADITYSLILDSAGIKAFTMPKGFFSDVVIHCWGAGGGKGRSGSQGGGGGYATATVNINEGDEVVLQIGQPGANGDLNGASGGVDPTYRQLRGGSSGTAQYWHGDDNLIGSGGGGGGASWVNVNEVIVCCAGGGGGAGGGVSYQAGLAGLPGGTYNALSTDTRGGNSITAYAAGGGGGGGYPKGGAAGPGVSDDAGRGQPGSGGQNYGNVTATGSGTLPGGLGDPYYPGHQVGHAGYPGYIVMIFRKKFNSWIKNPDLSGDWVRTSAAYIKVGNIDITSTYSTPVTTEYSAWPTSASALNTYLDSILAGGDINSSETAWYVINPPLTNQIFADSPYYNKSLVIMKNGDDVLTGSASSTSINSNGVTYDRGTLAYTASISKTIPGVGALNHTVSVYNYSTSVISTQTDVLKTISGGWKQIQNAFVKESGVWKPFINNEPIALYPYPVKRRKVTITLNADTDDYVLFDNIPVQYFEGLMDVTVNVNSGVVIKGANTQNAFTIDSFTVGDTVILNNQGTIQGRGGDGGSGGNENNYWNYWYSYWWYGWGHYSTPGADGAAGGVGLVANFPVTVINAGTIAGGGGGGGGGGAGYYNYNYYYWGWNWGWGWYGSYRNGIQGGGGGGGAGYGTGAPYGGSNGTLTAGGAGGTPAYGNYNGWGTGGDGGDRGLPGSAGQAGNSYYYSGWYYYGWNGYSYTKGGGGGAAGQAYIGVNNITFSGGSGTIIGPIA